jgi:hypothetical protein
VLSHQKKQKSRFYLFYEECNKYINKIDYIIQNKLELSICSPLFIFSRASVFDLKSVSAKAAAQRCVIYQTIEIRKNCHR